MPIVELKRVVGNKIVAQAIDIQLTRLVASMNLKWNLSDGQIQQIVEDLMDKFPNETIEDFILIFKKARQNEFGEIYRLDSAVIFGWVEKYLDEKYQVIEGLLMKEKENPYERIKPVHDLPEDDPEYYWHDAWLENLSRQFKTEKIGNVNDPEWIKKHGQEKPLRKSLTSGFAYFEVRGIKLMAGSQQHAEEIVQRMLELGELEEDI